MRIEIIQNRTNQGLNGLDKPGRFVGFDEIDNKKVDGFDVILVAFSVIVWGKESNQTEFVNINSGKEF